MVIIHQAQPGDFPAIAGIIAAQNQITESHCIQSASSEDPQIIQREMETLLAQDELLFVVAEIDGQITGCLGCEFERGIGRGWMRGPFLTTPHWDRIPAAMLHELLSILPPEIRRLDSFLNEKNELGHKFYGENGFKQMCLAHVYEAEKETLGPLQATACSRLTEAQVDSFTILHNSAFPETFITGTNIIRKINEDHQVFVHPQGQPVNGYVYSSIDTHAGEGIIEFLAVQPAQRGQGIGLKLLKCALAWCFFEKGVSKVALTVDQELTNARALYERAGFQLRYTGVNDRKEF
jgi:ribosomal protein S18 acetylase RimI-like enzyme